MGSNPTCPTKQKDYIMNLTKRQKLRVFYTRILKRIYKFLGIKWKYKTFYLSTSYNTEIDSPLLDEETINEMADSIRKDVDKRILDELKNDSTRQ